MFCLALTGWAGVVLQVDSQYESGATFSGLVTFTNDFSNVLAVDGWLVGDLYGNDHVNWIWDPSTNYASGYGSQYGGNFLMDNAYFITFTWDFSGAPTSLVFATPADDPLSAIGGNNISYGDRLVSGHIGAVPEPATIGLLGAGLLGLLFFRRRR
jgi:hypothetical protein